MTKKLSAEEKQARKPIGRACVFCHEKHLQCDRERPCKNCIKRGISDSCRDIQRKRAKYLNLNPSSKDLFMTENSPSLNKKRSLSSTSESSNQSHNTTTSNITQFQQPIQPDFSAMSTKSLFNEQPSKSISKDISPVVAFANIPESKFDTAPSESTEQFHNQRQPITKIIPEVTTLENIDYDKFDSNFINQEYLMLSDILASKPTSPSQYSDNQSRPFIQLAETTNMSDNYDTPNSNNQSTNRPSNQSYSNNTPTPQPSSSKQPYKNEYATEKDDPEFTSPLITRHIYQTIQDIYSKPIYAYNYPSGYHALTKYLKSRFNQKQLLTIIKCMASYRPTFIAATRSLIGTDLIYLEQTFQRSLIDYEYLCSLNSSPTIIWRRTGEIVNITPEFSSLTGYSSYDILSKRTFLFEILDDDSVLNYFKLFKAIAIGNLLTTISTSCKILKNNRKRKSINDPQSNEQRFIDCTSVWTIKRDIFDLPMLIVGQFLPVLEPGDYKFN